MKINRSLCIVMFFHLINNIIIVMLLVCGQILGRLVLCIIIHVECSVV